MIQSNDTLKEHVPIPIGSTIAVKEEDSGL